MEKLSVNETLNMFACPACSAANLAPKIDKVACPDCGREYDASGGVIDFVVKELLNKTNHDELGQNAGLNKTTYLEKDKLNPLYNFQYMQNIKKAAGFLKDCDHGWTLVSLGSGSGMEIKLLSHIKKFKRCFSSDIDRNKTAWAEDNLKEVPGEIGLFASDFDHCPVRKNDKQIGLVYQALHHSADAMQSLAHLLDNNFDHLIIVEPVTNWLIEALTFFKLAKRPEGTGATPDWLKLSAVKELAKQKGFVMETTTWWELPLFFLPASLGKFPLVWKPYLLLVDACSRFLNLFNFGCHAAIRFRKV